MKEKLGGLVRKDDEDFGGILDYEFIMYRNIVVKYYVALRLMHPKSLLTILRALLRLTKQNRLAKL